MANCTNLSEGDIAKLMEASDSKEEDAPEYENHTSDETERKNSDDDFDIDIQSEHYI